MRGGGEGGVAGEERVVGEPKFHSWGKCTMAVTNIHFEIQLLPLASACITVFLQVATTIVATQSEALSKINATLQ